ncbi:hypothetical protein Y032_0702g1661 [Ancylostoma ceylanicum]|uniref:GIY-YIG domain-containing protein n=1 Tax=Ancylostoma ceylanicum TaxID=53326 RepID=A0A016WGC1_9BILA|nr:hypothetical protein Y032_0702g1661 [Ancylostoma ceylanicum]
MYSGNEEKGESVDLACTIAISNGYSTRERRGTQRCTQMQNRNVNTEKKVQFCMPFISDEVSRPTRLYLRRANLESLFTLVELSPNNLKRQLTRNHNYDRLRTTSDCAVCSSGREGDCMRSCVIYVIKCIECDELYVSGAARPLCIKVKEYLEGKSSSLGRHRAQAHNGIDSDVQVTILAGESETSARKTLEEFWIYSKNPKMNRREECHTIISELLPYLAASNI